jgi:hypothetical protein
MTAATPFTEMAALIAHNDESRFAGAVVVVPPGGGDPISFMLTDPSPDLIQFWATVKARVEVRATEALQAMTDQARGYGGFR